MLYMVPARHLDVIDSHLWSCFDMKEIDIWHMLMNGENKNLLFFVSSSMMQFLLDNIFRLSLLLSYIQLSVKKLEDKMF